MAADGGGLKKPHGDSHHRRTAVSAHHAPLRHHTTPSTERKTAPADGRSLTLILAAVAAPRAASGAGIGSGALMLVHAVSHPRAFR